MDWQQFIRTLDPRVQSRLVSDISDGLSYTRQTAQVITDNGQVGEAVRQIDAALACLNRARRVLTTPPARPRVGPPPRKSWP